MEEFDIYKDISERTNGDIYIGVVGPVRVGKSTFISRFMELMVLPKIENVHEKERVHDELPQSAQGNTIMTTQPKFVPSNAVKIKLNDKVEVGVRLVDCVGYLINGATGHMDGDLPRMVKTPWRKEEIPFEDAAEYGTKKVITEHATVGVVITSDGSILTGIPREDYVPGEEKVINELKELKKPFVIILNSSVPQSLETERLAKEMEEKYNTAVIPMNVMQMEEQDICNIFEKLLYEFPIRKIDFMLPKWVQALPIENDIIQNLLEKINTMTTGMQKISQQRDEQFENDEYFDSFTVNNIILGEGNVIYDVKPNENLFYKALSLECGLEIKDDCMLMSILKDLIYAKKKYDKMKEALDQVKEFGYGVVQPSFDEMTLEEPQIVKHGGRFGVKLKASAPSLHIIQVDIQAEVSPIVGSEAQSEELVKFMLKEFENNPKSIWQTNMFGKSLQTLINERLNNKINNMPDDTQRKMRKTLGRIINEGKGGIICILL